MQTLHIDGKAKETLARAAEKARTEKPLVKKTATPGVYAVNGKYTVTCNSQNKTISCTCKATKPCYHIAAVAPLHSYIKKQEREAAQAAPASLLICPDCGLDNSDMPGGDDGLEYCTNCGADLYPVDASLPEIDFDAIPQKEPVTCYRKFCTSLAETDGLCSHHALELAADYSDLFGG